MTRTETLRNQVLEFALGDERFCIDIGDVKEIVNKDGDLSHLPGSSPDVAGMLDLRGEVTEIRSPRRSLGIPETGDREEEKIIILDTPGDTSVGWLVDDVSSVAHVAEEDLDTAVDEPYVRGVVNRGDTLILWIDTGEVNGGAK